jgi:hypothetical protein
MRLVCLCAYFYVYVAIVGLSASYFSGLKPVAINQSRKDSGIGIVIEQATDFFCGKIGVAHAIRSLKAIVGEVMQGVCRPFALRQYNTVGI